MTKLLWWGYLHKNGSLQAKRYIDDTSWPTPEEQGPAGMVADVYGPFEAEDRLEALKIVGENTSALLPNSLKAYMKLEGFLDYKLIPGRGICGIWYDPNTKTYDLLWGLDFKDGSYLGKWCYEDPSDAVMALHTWPDTSQDPLFNWQWYATPEGTVRNNLDYVKPN
jgi:hypothetical protein